MFSAGTASFTPLKGEAACLGNYDDTSGKGGEGGNGKRGGVKERSDTSSTNPCGILL